MVATAQLLPGTLVDGRYQVERLVGAGGMGAVYEATQVLLGRRVALKILHGAYATSPEIVERFHREARLAASIGHDNICEVTDLGRTDDGSPYLVMPLLVGFSLGDLLEQHKRLPVKRTVDIMCQMLSGLDAAHQHRIVHRDLKPDNIFVTRMGDREDFVKLLDFGVSKMLDKSALGGLTMTGTVLGTPYYMSPEQAKGSKTIDHRVDIYASGVILYEVLTGLRPFEGDSYNEVMFKIVGDPFLPPTALNPEIPAALEQVVLRSMAHNPEERYASAFVMRQALEAAIAEVLEVTSTPPALVAGTFYDSQPPLRAERASPSSCPPCGPGQTPRPASPARSVATAPSRPSSSPTDLAKAPIEAPVARPLTPSTPSGSGGVVTIPRRKQQIIAFAVSGFVLLAVLIGVVVAKWARADQASSAEVVPIGPSEQHRRVAAEPREKIDLETAPATVEPSPLLFPPDSPPLDISATSSQQTEQESATARKKTASKTSSRGEKPVVVPGKNLDASRGATSPPSDREKKKIVEGRFGTKFVFED